MALMLRTALICSLSLASASTQSDMAKISELADGGALQSGDLLVVARGTTNRSLSGIRGEIDGKENVGVAASAVATHEAAGNPHAVYLTQGEADALYEALGVVATHEGAADPHPGYLTAAEGDAAYEALGAVATHAAAADPHTGYQRESERNAASGYAGLDASSKLTGAQQVYGSALDTACQGNDSRLSDARTPLTHDILTVHSGFPGGSTNFLREDGTWQAAGGSTPVATTATQGKVKVDNDSAGDPVALTSAGHGAAADPHTQYQRESEKGAASGYSSLDAGTKVPIAQLPTGATSTTVCIGNDARLSDARTPTAHATTHKTGGADAIKLDELAAPTDVTTLNASTTVHGLLLKLSGSASDVLKGDGTWGAVVGGNDPRIITKELTADQTHSSTTMNSVNGLDQAVQAGTWWFEYRCIYQSTVAGTGVKFGVDFTGTQTRFVVEATGSEATTAASSGAMDQVHAAFGLRSGGGNRAPSVSTAIFGSISVDTVNADMLAIIKGVIVVTVAGNLRLYFGSEVTASGTQTIESGSALRLTKVSA